MKVWVRHNDNSKAEKLLAYFRDVDHGDKEDQKEDYVRIRWDNDIGKTVRVPTSRIENFDEVSKTCMLGANLPAIHMAAGCM